MSVSSADNRSTQSSVSISNTPTKCPYCSWNKKGSRLFHHIWGNHGDQIYSAIGTIKSITKDLEDDCLLRLNMTWTDFAADDEFKEFEHQDFHLDIYGCLGCHGTYTTRAGAKSHWKKSEKCHKEHTNQVNKYISKLTQFQKSQGDKSWIDAMSDKELYDAIERLARWYWRVTKGDIPDLLNHILNQSVLFPEKYSNLVIQRPIELKTRKERVEKYKDYCKVLHDLEIWMGRNITMPFEYRIPNPWNFSTSPEEDGLPPVGHDFNLPRQ